MALTDNILAYWKLDESSWNADDSVWSNDLTNSNVTYTTWKINNCWSFNNSTSYYTCPLDFQSSSAFSVSYWFNPSSFASPDNHIRFEEKIILGSLWTAAWCYLIDSSSWYSQSFTVAATFATGNWYHVACTFASWTFLYYVNWSLIQTKTSRTTNTGAKSTQYIWREWAWNYFHWLLDELGIRDRALTWTEVTELYNSGSWLQYPFGSSSAIKTVNWLAKASVKTVKDLAIASVKTINDLA